MAPDGVSVHAARVDAKAPWAEWSEDDGSVVLADDLARGAEHFSKMKLSAVVLGHSSSSILGGPGWDAATVAQLSDVIGGDTTVTTNGLDCQAALEAVDIKRPFLVFPAWFGDPMIPKGEAYFTAQGFQPSGSLRYDPGPGWRDRPPERLYPEGIAFEQQVEPLYRQIRAACPDEADGVLIAGTGFRCVAIIDALEQALGRPVISANQASLWSCLRKSGVHDTVTGYGRLLEWY